LQWSSHFVHPKDFAIKRERFKERMIHPPTTASQKFSIRILDGIPYRCFHLRANAMLLEEFQGKAGCRVGDRLFAKFDNKEKRDVESVTDFSTEFDKMFS
jgi:hypothetical protein